MFMGSRRIPQPNWGYGLVRTDLYRLQPLREVIQRLWHRGLMGADLFYPSGSTTLSVGDDHVDVYGAKLP
jgi:hypothetical protein